MKLSRIYHTVRYLKPRQIVGQAHSIARARLEDPARFASRSVPSYPGCRWKPAGPFLSPGIQDNDAGEILAGRMSFINQTQAIGWMPDWDRADLPKLWSYNLHYFEWIWAFDGDGVESAKEAVLDWIERCPLKKDSVGWEAYPTTLRLMNLCAFFFGENKSRVQADEAFTERLWKSVWLQAEWLSSHLEYRLLGNHLLEDAGALALAGACFDGPDAARWLELGLKLLREQVAEQVPSDGLHFELSPMYHSRIVYLLLTLHNTGDSRVRAIVGPVLGRVLDALAHMCHPDGRISLLNDSAFGVYNKPDDLFGYAASLGIGNDAKVREASGPWLLSDAGYYGYRGKDGSYIICDAGQLGPDYIPGHAHADMFSFELSLNGCRVIVDCGVHDYECSETRAYCRSTRAHNTVEIAGQDQAEMWGAFRVARRGYPQGVDWRPTSDGFELAACHNGYCRLPGRPIHCRSFSWSNSGFLKVTDRVTTSRAVECRSYLHLHPDCSVEQQRDDEVLVTYPAGHFLVRFSGPGRLECVDGQYHPEFYVTQRNTILAYSWTVLPGGEEVGFSVQTQPSF